MAKQDKRKISFWDYATTSISMIVIFMSFMSIFTVVFDRVGYPSLFTQGVWFVFILITSGKIGSIMLKK